MHSIKALLFAYTEVSRYLKVTLEFQKLVGYVEDNWKII